jgi:hypothetical protein
MQTCGLSQTIAVDEIYLRSAAAFDSNVLGKIISQAEWNFLKDTPVATIPWSSRAKHALAEAQCQNLGDVVMRTSLEWAGRRKIGSNTVRELARRLRDALRLAGMTVNFDEADAKGYYGQLVRYYLARPELIPDRLWSSMVKDLKASGVARYSVGLAASLASERWPASRSHERLKRYLTKAAAAFFKTKVLDKNKTRALAAMLLKLWLRQKTNGEPGAQSDDLKIGTIEQNIQSNQVRLALAEACVRCGVRPKQKAVLDLRYGLFGQPPRLWLECARITRRTLTNVTTLARCGERKLSQNPDNLRVLQCGLRAIQHRVWRQMAEANSSLIPKTLSRRELCRRAGGPETLLIRVCHGDMRTWLDQTLASTPEGWQIPM